MTVEQQNDDPRDQFPIGMRVLAVDDDPTCLKLLETLLRRCQYHVTTTSQARTALQMLRENKNRFDLVISDVHMPDMDGFKLLELVGLDMDLPVIMLSANGDTKLVMKGISHGACDYLLKPVRIEELKNIWQHVIRRKKIEPKSQKASGNQERNNGGSGEGETGSAGTGNSDQYGKSGKRRKDQNEDEDDDRDEDDEENDDPSTQKKPRVVWSVELHRKFVAAVNQLGIDKAVPKKILDLMNVEKLTRENVASHLQKYRLYLKRINCVANQQANMVAAFGTTDPSYLRMGPINGHGHYNPVQFLNQPFRSYPPGGMVGRLNSPSGLEMTCLPSSGGMIQLGNSNDHVKFHENGVLQGMPMPFELDRHHGEGSSHIGDLSTSIDEISGFPISSGINDPKIPANLLMQGGRDYGNPSLKSEFCSSMANLHRGNESWSGSSQSKSFLLSDRFKQTAMHSSSGSRMAGNQFDATPMADSQCQVSGISNGSLIQAWDAHRQNAMSSSMNPLNIPINNGSVGCLEQSLEPKNPIFHRNAEFNHMGQPNYADSLMTKYDEVEKSTMPYLQRTQGDFIPSNSFGPLGDVVSAMMKQEHDKHEGDFGGYTLGNGI